jgi:hypothetical protein
LGKCLKADEMKRLNFKMLLGHPFLDSPEDQDK